MATGPRRNGLGLADRLSLKPQRHCLSMHECCLCPRGIAYGDEYYDGGHGRRAHVSCVIDELSKRGETMIFKIEAQGDTVYIEAESEKEACDKLSAVMGPIPSALLTISTVTELPDGEELL